MGRDTTRFFSPVLDAGLTEICGKCNACRHACPVHAIDVQVSGITVDRAACHAEIVRQGGECFDCLLACKHNVLVLRKFAVQAGGTIARVS